MPAKKSRARKAPVVAETVETEAEAVVLADPSAAAAVEVDVVEVMRSPPVTVQHQSVDELEARLLDVIGRLQPSFERVRYINVVEKHLRKLEVATEQLEREAGSVRQ